MVFSGEAIIRCAGWGAVTHGVGVDMTRCPPLGESGVCGRRLRPVHRYVSIKKIRKRSGETQTQTYGSLMEPEKKNLVWAFVLSLVILLGWQFLYELPRQTGLRQTFDAQQTPDISPGISPGAQSPSEDGAGVSGPVAPGLPRPEGDVRLAPSAAAPGSLEAADATDTSPRVPLEAPALMGSLRLRGGLLDDVVLRFYKESLEADSGQIRLLAPQGSSSAYYAGWGWLADTQGLALPDRATLWQVASGATLAPGAPLVLFWENGQGLRFERVYEIDTAYLITVKRSVRNLGTAPVRLASFSWIQRNSTPVTENFYLIHEGVVGGLGLEESRLREYDYTDLQETTRPPEETHGGWIGFTDKYWLVSMLSANRKAAFVQARALSDGSDFRYQLDMSSSWQVLPAGGSLVVEDHLYVGAKEIDVLQTYQDRMDLPLFDRAVDFGWFYFLTKPMFLLLAWLNGHTQNFGLAIMLITILVKLALFPLAYKSYVSISRMKVLQPEVEKLRERFKEDRMQLQQNMMALYRTHKVNPAAGCLPILLQIPIFFSLYKVIFVTIEMRHAPFFGWIQDLSAPDPLGVLTLFGLVDWRVPAFLALINIGIWPIIMGATMALQMRLNPTPTDPLQKKIFTWMPVVFTFFLAGFPAGLVVYWAWNNTLSIGQQYLTTRMIARRQAPP